MTQQDTAVGGATDDTVIAAEPTIEDRFSAIADDELPEDDDAEPAQADDAELPEEDEPEAEPDEPAITPPVSWTAEEQEEFKSLPRSMQETLTRREAEREKFVQSKANEAKSARVAVQQQAVQELQGIHAQNIAALQAMLPQIPDRPSAYLQVQDPHSYAAAMDEHEWAVAQHNQVQQLMQGIAGQHAQAQDAMNAQRNAYTHEVLQDEFPEFLDPVKGPELKQQLRSTALALGFSDDRLSNLDAHEILAARTAHEWKVKADKFDALNAKKMETVRNAKEMPRVSRPGTPQGKGAAANQRYTADRNAMRNGDKDAGARVFKNFL